MRKDMSKVVTERPRHGHYLPSRKTRLRIRRYDPNKDYDDLPKRVSGSRNKHLLHAQAKLNRSYERVKYFSDLIGPLQRFLRSNVGRPWDEVFSEMKQTLDSRKVTGNHIFEHVEMEVELHPLIGKDGRIYESYPHYRGSRLLSGLYVDPRTGLLCWAERIKEPVPKNEPPEVTHILLGKTCGYFKLEGIWHFVEFIKVPIRKMWVYERSRGCWFRDKETPTLPLSGIIQLPNDTQFIVVKKDALTRQERRFAGLRNDPNTARGRNAGHQLLQSGE